uniref:WxxW domain-containing protein n=1 Tax=Cyclopterus lumpus TaxID=8103 RepID=A0A8C2WGZ4_CYCLU
MTLKATNVNLLVALVEGGEGITKVRRIHPLGTKYVLMTCHSVFLLSEVTQLLDSSAETETNATRVCWTKWFDRDNPSGPGDYEILYSLRKQYPGQICPNPGAIEAQTLTGISALAAGEKIYRSDTTTGFICRNRDQRDKRCQDYRVRFSCPSSFCTVKVCWTKWFDRDNPSGTGDWELLSSLRKENPGKICRKPLFIKAVTTDTNTPASSTGNNFFMFHPSKGLVCRNRDQRSRKCRDYKVKFGCPCP